MTEVKELRVGRIYVSVGGKFGLIINYDYILWSVRDVLETVGYLSVYLEVTTNSFNC